ncbi:MAG: hypothetical protein QF507_03760 [Vicinamibacterales bacterium]|nr:hypothetical protein [Vicinamibacterales bacterium]
MKLNKLSMNVAGLEGIYAGRDAVYNMRPLGPEPNLQRFLAPVGP